VSIKQWSVIHTWSSLLCTLFLLTICISGLPLIFADEIRAWTEQPLPYAQVPADAPRANLDGLVEQARRRYPKEQVLSLFIDDDAPRVIATVAPSAAVSDKQGHLLSFDAHTGAVLEDEPPFSAQPRDFLGVMFALHTDLFAGLTGELFLGAMGLAFVLAIVSGVVLYAPFMRKLAFGAVRRERRVPQWLDLHNLVGIVTVAWCLVVGVTGVINELSTPLFGLWRVTEAKALIAPDRGRPALDVAELAPVQRVYDTAAKALPGRVITSITFPGGDTDSSTQHYLLWARGSTPITSQLFSPVLIDGRSGALTALIPMPWYLRVLELSRPLHFGDYGGLPLKILWALFDAAAIAILGSGVYLWAARRRGRGSVPVQPGAPGKFFES
jgi:uncharacterized iron-regulated membrane protein